MFYPPTMTLQSQSNTSDTHCTIHKREVVSSFGCDVADKYLRRFIKREPSVCSCAVGEYCVHIPDWSNRNYHHEWSAWEKMNEEWRVSQVSR